MSCTVRNINDYKKLSDSLRNKVGSDNVAYMKYAEAALSDEFIEYCKDTLNFDLDLDGDMRKIIPALMKYYNNIHPDVNATAIASDNKMVGGFSSVDAREFGKRHVGSLLNDFFFQANVKGGFEQFIINPDNSNRLDVFNNYKDAVTKRVYSEFRERYKVLQDKVKHEDGFKKILENNKETPMAGVMQVIKKYGDLQDKNITALFNELNSNSQRFFSEVFRDSRLAPMKQEFRGEISELENADEDSIDGNEEDTISQDDDSIDTYITTLNQKLGDYSSFMQHVDIYIKCYFNGLKRLKSTNKIDDNYDYDKNNELGVVDTMNNDECCLAMFSYGDFTSVDSMIESVRTMSNNLHEFRGFAKFADDLSNDRDFVNYIYTNFGKTIISKVETLMEHEAGKVNTSNKAADKLSQLSFNFLNSIKTSSIENEDIDAKEIVRPIREDIKSYKGKIDSLQGFEKSGEKDLYDIVLGHRNIVKLRIKNSLFEYIHRYYPTVTSGAISSFLENNEIDGNKDFSTNANSLVTLINSTITGSYETQVNYNSRQAEINKAFAYNEELRLNNDYVNPNKFIDLSQYYNTSYLSQTSKSAAIELAKALEPFELVKTSLNSRNINGNNSSDVINNSMFTNIINTLKNEKALKNFGKYKFQGNQYDLSNIMLETYDDKGDIINYGLFTREDGELKPTIYANQLISSALYNGASDLFQNKNASYSQMSKGDYTASAFINFFNAEAISGDTIHIPMANYFSRIPSDAPKTFVIKAPKYSTKDLFKIVDSKAATIYLQDKIKEIYKSNISKAIGEEKDYYSLYDNSIDKDVMIEHLTAETTGNIYLPKSVKLVNPRTKNGEQAEIVYSYNFSENKSIDYIVRGTYMSQDGKMWLERAEFVGLLEDFSSELAYLPEEIKSAINDINLKKAIKKGDIKQSIDVEHPVFKQFKNIFIQELTNAATAIDKLFVHTNGVVELDKNNMPLFKDGYDNTPNTSRKLYDIYHHAPGKNVLEADGKGLYKLTGRVFSSDRFEMYDRKTNKVVNLLDGIMKEDGVMSFLYGGVSSSLPIHSTTNGIEVRLTDAQQQAVNDAISKFIIAYSEDAIDRMKGYEAFIPQDMANESNYIEFALNNHLMYNGFNDLLEGDSKFYKNTQTFLKRAKESQGSGIPYGITNYAEPLTETRKKIDSTLDSENINVTYIGVDGTPQTRKVEQFNRFNAVTIKNTVRNSDAIERLTKELIKNGVDKAAAEKMMKGYERVTTNDAQSYITYEEWIRRTAAKGELKKYKKLINAINDESKPIDAATLSEWVQVQKNFYYDQHYNKDLGVFVPRQIKNAEFVLVPRFIKGTELERVYNLMMENNVDQLNTEEASKAAKANILTLWDDNGIITDKNWSDFNSNIKSSIEEFNYNYLYKQQDTSQHMDSSNKAGIQIMKKMLDNIDSNNPLWKYKDSITKNYIANIKESFTELMEEFGIALDKNGNIKLNEDGTLPSLNNKVFYDRLLEEAERLGVDSNMLDYLTLKDDVAEPLMPNYMSNVSTKLESIAQALFNSTITRQKLPGFHAAQVTNVGFTATKDEVGISKKLRYKPEVDGKVQPYIEVMIAKPAQLAHLSDDAALAAMQSSSIDEFIGYRIPTEGKQSVAIMKVVAFIDNAQGSTIIVPDDWVAQTGSNFEIDSIYGITHGFYVDKYDEVVRIKYHAEANEDAYSNYVRNNVNRKLKNGYKLSQTEIDKYKSDYKGYIDNINKENEDLLNNKVKDLLNEENSIYKNADPIIREALHLVDDTIKKNGSNLKYLDKVEVYIVALEETLIVKPDAISGKAMLNLYKEVADIISLQKDFSAAKLEQYKETIGENIIEYIKDRRFEDSKKMAEISNLLSYEEFTKSPVEVMNSRAARNNQITSDMLNILRSDLSIEENLSRSNFDNIVAARDKMQNEDVKRRRNNRSPYNFFDQADFQEDVMAGAKLKAVSVTRDTFCSVCNTAKTRLNDINSVKIIYYKSDGYDKSKLENRFGKENIESSKVGEEIVYIIKHDKLGWSNDNKNVEDELITAYSSQTTAHILDAVKEGAIPNVNDLTFGVYKTFPDIGSNYSTGISFIMQPGITRIVDAYNKNKSIYNKGGNFNPVHSAIKSIAQELGLSVNEYTPINLVIAELQKSYGEQMKHIYGMSDKFTISFNSSVDNNIGIDNHRLANRLNAKDTKDNKVYNLVFDLGVVLQYNKLSLTAKNIGDFARVTNPDKFGAKQTIFATNKVFDDIQTLVTEPNTSTALYVLKNNEKVNLLKAIYPDAYKGIDAYIKSTDTYSAYPSLNAFLKYSTATSIKVNRSLFKTEKISFRKAVAGIEDYLSGNMTEKLYKDVKNYILSKVYSEVPVINSNINIINGVFNVNAEYNYEKERARVYGYSKTPNIDFEVNDINDLTESELNKFTELSPAQKIYWIQQNFRNPGVFSHIKVNLFNEYEYRKNKISKQKIEYVDNTVNIETVLYEFEKAFFNSNQLVRLAALDVIKYAALVEGFVMKRNGISKIIKNSALYSSIADGGVNFVNEVNTRIDLLSDSNLHSVYHNYIRSHSTIPQIQSYRNKKLNKVYEINTGKDYNIVSFNLSNNESRELAIKSGFVTSYSRRDGFIEYNTAPYVRLITKNKATLYKVVANNNNVYAYPLNLLEGNENSKWSANVSNNMLYKDEAFYTAIINKAIETNSNISALSEEFKKLAEQSKFINPNKVDKTKFVKPFDLNNPPNAHVGGFTAIVNHIDKTFDNIDSPVSTWIRSMALTNYIPIGETAIQTIGTRSYLIKRVAMRDSAKAYLKSGKLNREIKELNEDKKAIIEKAREMGLTSLNDVFNITPFNGTIIVENYV